MKKFSEFKVNEEIESAYEHNKVTINLKLDINPSFVKSVQSQLDHYGIDENVEDVLHDYFLYKTGYDFDYTYASGFDVWLEDRMSDTYTPKNI
jgi:hypothetical protein